MTVNSDKLAKQANVSLLGKTNQLKTTKQANMQALTTY